MICAGVAWGIYSLRGKAVGDAVSTTAGNFVRALVFAVALTIALISWSKLDYAGIIYASFSGAIASGLGYVIWYSALPGLNAASAASVQLSVPILAAVGGILFLNESITSRLFIAAVAVLGGIGLVVIEKASVD
jgi:drug/metabolite transporter (DMT)-like permease